MYINILYSFENNIYNWVLEYCIDCAFPTMPWHVLVTYNLHFDGRIGRRKGQRGGVEGFFVPSGRDKRKMGGLQYTMLYIHVHTSVQAEVCIFKAAKKGLQDLESVSVFQVCHHQWGDYFICHCAPLQLHTTETKNAQAGQVPLCTKNMQQFQMIKAPLKQLSKRHSKAKF